ncbi:9111_t:CDS:1, partial [Acaulospora morrowiae]
DLVTDEWGKEDLATDKWGENILPTSSTMPLVSKKKRAYKNQLRDKTGRFGASKKFKITEGNGIEKDPVADGWEEEDLVADEGGEEDLVTDEWGKEDLATDKWGENILPTSSTMPLVSKKKRAYKNQLRNKTRRFGASKKFKTTEGSEIEKDPVADGWKEENLVVDKWGEENLVTDKWGKEDLAADKWGEKDLAADEWGDEEDSNWEDEIDFQESRKEHLTKQALELVWKDNTVLENQKRGPYLVGPTKKSTYYEKWGPNGAYTIATKGTKKINEYFSSRDDSNSNSLFSDEVLNNVDRGDGWASENTLQKITALKT